MEIKSKQLTVLLLSVFIFTLGFGITVPIMPFFAKSMGGTVVDVGILMALFSMASLEATLGFFAMDRYGLSEMPSAMPLLWTSIELTGTNLLGIAYLFVGVAGVLTQVLLVGKLMESAGEVRTIALGFVLAGAGTILLIMAWELSLLLVGAVLIALGIGLLTPSINTAVSNRTGREHQGVTMGLLGSFNSAGRAAGPVAGGLAYSVSMLLPYALSAVISLFSALLIMVWHVKGNCEKNAATAVPAEH